MYDKAAWIRPANTYFFRIISIPGIDSFFSPSLFFSFFFLSRVRWKTIERKRGPSNRTRVSNNQLSIVIDLAEGKDGGRGEINCFIGVWGTL